MKLFPFLVALIFLTNGAILVGSTWSAAVGTVAFSGGMFILALMDGICDALSERGKP